MDAEHRARLATLDALHRHPDLSGRYVLKGGLVLQHIYGSPRPSEDLDFNSVERFTREITEGKDHLLVHFGHALEDALRDTAPRFGLAALAVQGRRLSDELPTLMTHIGYATDEGMQPPFEHTVEMQVTLSEVVCDYREAALHGVPVLVPTLEDLVADKLKVLLQQPFRPTTRTTDVWDLWYALTQTEHEVNPTKVADFLTRKCEEIEAVRNPGKTRFHDAEVRREAEEGYRKLAAEATWKPVPSFEEAFGVVLRFTDRLPLPD